MGFLRVMLQATARFATFGTGSRSGRQRLTARGAAETRGAPKPLQPQLARARERGRGRQANSPERIPWRGWRDIFYRTYLGVTTHRVLEVAAGVAFYEILAIFPGLSALVSIYGFFASGAQIRHHLALLATIVPAQAIGIIGDQIDRIAAKGSGNLSVTFLISLAVSIWSANAGVKAIFDALNVIYDEDEKRNFLRLNFISLLLTLGLIGFLLIAIAGVVAVPLMFSAIGAGVPSLLSISLLRWPVLFAIVTVALSILYRFGPSRRPAKWRWLSVGSVAGAVTWLVGSVGFSWYLGHIADYDAAYGSLGAAIGLMIWLWLSAIVVLLGAQLNAEIEHQTARDSTIGEIERPLGQRDAVMADTVGAAQS
jgi:membrane protein